MHKIEKCFRKGNKGGDAGKAVRSAHGVRLAPIRTPKDREGGDGRAIWTHAGVIHGTLSKDGTNAFIRRNRNGG